MDNILELLKILISQSYDDELRQKGFVAREFYEREALLTQCKLTISSISSYNNISAEDLMNKFNAAIREVKYVRQTTIEESISLTKSDEESWLNSERFNELGWDNENLPSYRNRYLNYLKHIGRPIKVVEDTRNSSLEIVKKLGDPKNSDPFFVKGLVVGSVQSGKTSNFNAVINSCVDLGYNLIIVLSGIMEDLRRQTQIRIEKEVEGKMESNKKFIGVGELASFGVQGKFPEITPITIPTSSLKDFSSSLRDSQFNLNATNILICKKNTSVLQNLILWLNDYLKEDGEKHNLPFILIDDEADNASLNNLGYKGVNYANKINGHIRALLAMFNRKSYLGYTATPFANVLQDWNEMPNILWPISDPINQREILLQQVGNLFPDDFIELLYPPSNYVGPKNFFETKLDEVKKLEPLLADPITDHLSDFPERVEVLEDGSLLGVKKYNSITEFEEDFGQSNFIDFKDYLQRTRATTKEDLFPQKIPQSLEEAVYCFILSIAIRLSRKPIIKTSKLYQPHNTMLVHISRFTIWQTKTKELLTKLLTTISVNLSNQKLEEEGSIYLEFERIWNKYFSDAINNIEDYLEYEDEFLIKKTFKEVREHLITAVNGTEIKAVNTLSKDVLDYESGEKKYIVIGGNKLSRGFTLEGLSINYFVRSTNFSDTLLQMGRWFGYRPGYIDCCKLFTTAETIEKFNLCTWTIEELESEFKKLVNSDPKKTPIEYATKVLTHPGVLKITRPSILKNSVLAQWSFEDRLVQTTSFILTKDRIEQSWSSFKSWIKNHDFQKHPSNDFMVLNAPSNVLFNLLSTQKVYPSTDAFDIEAIQRYISLANDCGKLMNWTIAIKTTGQARIFNGEVSGLDFGLQLKTISTSLRYRKEFLKTKIFKAYGASSNIITSGKDLSVSLTKDQIESAETEFKRIKPDSSFPERIYRERISDTQGVLIIYLMDLEKIFTQDDEMIEFAQNENLDLVSTPLIGFALGFPPIDQRISGNYLLNKRILENIKNAQNEELDNLPFLNEGDEDEFESINEDIN